MPGEPTHGKHVWEVREDGDTQPFGLTRSRGLKVGLALLAPLALVVVGLIADGSGLLEGSGAGPGPVEAATTTPPEPAQPYVGQPLSTVEGMLSGAGIPYQTQTEVRPDVPAGVVTSVRRGGNTVTVTVAATPTSGVAVPAGPRPATAGGGAVSPAPSAPAPPATTPPPVVVPPVTTPPVVTTPPPTTTPPVVTTPPPTTTPPVVTTPPPTTQPPTTTQAPPPPTTQAPPPTTEAPPPVTTPPPTSEAPATTTSAPPSDTSAQSTATG